MRTPVPPPAPAAPARSHDGHQDRPRERGAAIGRGFTWLATWSLRILLVAAASVLLGLLVGRLWSVVLPVLLALLLASVLWPPTAWLRRRRVPPALASLVVLLGSLVVLFGGLGLLAPSVVSQVGDLAAQAANGLRRVQGYVTGPPLNLADAQVDAAVDALTERLQGSASRVAAGVLTGVTAVTNVLVTAALALVLVFFFLKDGPRFLPWLTGVIGHRAGHHVETVLVRSWGALGSFIQGQALVGLVDAVLIGIGLVLVGVPLALPLAVFTFFGGFIPIIGAFFVGALAVLIALVTKGTTAALIVTVLIFAVQQIEGNVLQPVLQGRGLRLHAAVVILAVAAGGGLFGIAGAFLAVPVAAVAAVVLRYLGEVLDGQTSQDPAGPEPDDAEPDRELVGEPVADVPEAPGAGP